MHSGRISEWPAADGFLGRVGYNIGIAVRVDGKPLVAAVDAVTACSGAPRGGSAPRSEHVLGYASRV